MNNPDTVRCKDMYCAAFLIASGIQPVKTELDGNGRAVWFFFNNTADTQEKILGFNIGVTVGVQTYVTALRRTRDLIFYAKGGSR